MKIRVEDIPKEGKELVFGWDDISLKTFITPHDPYNIRIDEPLFVRMFLVKEKNYIRVRGKIEGGFFARCHKCLEEFTYPVNIKIETFLYSQTDFRVDTEDEIELDKEDLNQEFFDGVEIDIDLVVAEEIFLSLPQVLVCSDNCKGLCPVCGSNRNFSDCGCVNVVRSPFAELLSLKKTLSS